MTNMAVLDVLQRTIYRAEHSKENPYTVLSNKLLRDPNIKRADKGLLVELLSWGDKHRVCIQALVKKGKEGRDAIQGMLNRLEEAGYIKRTQLKNSDGTFGKVVYQIFESPIETKILAQAEYTASFSDAQLGFNFDEFDENNAQAANGFSVCGESTTNKYNELRSNNLNNINRGGDMEKRNELLEKYRVLLKDPIFLARLQMAGLGSMIQTQDQLDHYLVDFNSNHDQYKNISDHQRLNNLIKFLLKIHHSPAGQRAHFARMQALGSSEHFNKPAHNKPLNKPSKDFSRFILNNSEQRPVQHQCVENHDDEKFNFEGF
ncbi:hypothetical protein KY206_003681 [Acinetobacter baumannii]|nr:hypothetical protein [Acinetobacter baumannii]EKU3010456.1 hypothetical protein [Acinetobacter baumannii]EKU8498928.1 hypothetical protein [Acinetobacter baumannii]EKU8557526.1 hypothetical protein [Acinetobacter baumannii]EKU8586430.1 hypothetical protein [Acinetobacter baumannii]